jgi:hypothetical protein
MTPTVRHICVAIVTSVAVSLGIALLAATLMAAPALGIRSARVCTLAR